MKKPKRDWKAIEEQATAAARSLGHELQPFMHRDQNSAGKMASCSKCGGSCWVSCSPTRGFTAGGRLLKFNCGDPQAAGFLNVRQQ